MWKESEVKNRQREHSAMGGLR